MTFWIGNGAVLKSSSQYSPTYKPTFSEISNSGETVTLSSTKIGQCNLLHVISLNQPDQKLCGPDHCVKFDTETDKP